MKPEARVKKQIKDYLIKRRLDGDPVWFYMPVQNGMGVTGIPDFIICCGGVFIAVETKAPGKLGNLSANQERQLNSIVLAGGTALVVDSAEAVIRLIDATI